MCCEREYPDDKKVLPRWTRGKCSNEECCRVIFVDRDDEEEPSIGLWTRERGAEGKESDKEA